MSVKPLSCKLLAKTLDRYRNNKQVIAAFKEFVRHKTANPTEPFGKKDYPFNKTTKLMHAGLTFDVSIIYSLSEKDPTLLKLYGIFSHDEAGTGQPPNRGKLDALVNKISNQEMHPF